MFGHWSTPPPLLRNVQTKEKKVPQNVWTLVDPPPFSLENIQTQAQKFGHELPPPLFFFSSETNTSLVILLCFLLNNRRKLSVLTSTDNHNL